jgi:hypothetical protein
MDQPWRAITSDERAILNRLLEADAPGREAAIQQLAHAVIRHEPCDHGGLCGVYFFLCERGPEITMLGLGVPFVEGHWTDDHDNHWELLLWVRGGKVSDLEVVNYASGPLVDWPHTSQLEVWSRFDTWHW